MKIGYFIPRFPSQTHIFYWRKIGKLREFGVEVELISTSSPKVSFAKHSWAVKAAKDTVYLFPPSLINFLGGCGVLIVSGPRRWKAALREGFLRAEDSSLSGRIKTVALFFLGANLAFIAKRDKLCHICVGTHGDSAEIAMFAFLISGVTYSLELNCGLSLSENQKQKWANSLFAIVVSKWLLREVEVKLQGYLPRTIKVSPDGLDTSVFKRSRPYIPWREGVYRIFSCGRLNSYKGHDDLIRAVGLLVQKGLNICLDIAGGEDEQSPKIGYRVYLENLIEELSLEGRACLLGSVSEDEVQNKLEASHIFVLYSMTEALGVAIMEAMAMEIPVISTKSGGISELIRDGQDGVLIEPKNPSLLARKIEEVMNDSYFAEQIGKSARRRVTELFDVRITAKTLFDCLQGLKTGVPNQ